MMTLSERRNYQFAILVSLFLHVGLCLIVFPIGSMGNRPKVQTYSAGLIDISSEPSVSNMNEIKPVVEKVVPAKDGDSVKSQAKVSPAPQSHLKEVQTEAKPQVKADVKTEIKPQLKAAKVEAQPHPTPVTKNDEDNNSKVAGAAQSGEHPPSGLEPHQGKPGPKSLGDGSGMASKRGILQQPGYPKAAMNEDKEGEVLLRVFLKADGSIERFEVKSGDDQFVKQAQSFVKRELQFHTNKDEYQVDILFSFKKSNSYQASYKFVGSQTRP